MANIQFIGRSKELTALKEIAEQNFFLIVKGRRRIGKTSLLRMAFPDAAYMFIWPDKSLDWILNKIISELELPMFRDFSSLLEYLMDQKKTIVMDEFQNFINIDKSIYGEIQALIDKRKQQKKWFNLAVAGSSYSLMNKVFYDSASPLYGRKTHEIDLGNIDVCSLYEELGIAIDEFIEFWSVFEGVPYYYELADLKKTARENIYSLILSKDSQLKDEGKAILSVEFGKDSRTYNTVLTGISEGKTKLNEISSLFGNKKNESIKYLDILRREFNLVRKITPFTENPRKSRMGKYEIQDNFLSFWFYFYDKNRAYIEQERFSEIKNYFHNEFNTYMGRKFEKFIKHLLEENIILPEAGLNQVGSQWGKSENGTYEIDVLARGSKEEILFGECKWQEDVSPLSLLNTLSEKSKFVDWHKGKRKEKFALFAKSFTRKVSSFEGKEVVCYDLKDIASFFRKKKSK